MMPTFHFDGYTMRPALPSDLPTAEAWNAADTDHKDTTAGSFWIYQDSSQHSFVLEKEGIVFFFKLCHIAQKTVEIHIQFPPDDLHASSRTMEGLIAGWGWMEKMLAETGFEVVYFKSRNPRLMYFCKRRLGFVQNGDTMQKFLKAA